MFLLLLLFAAHNLFSADRYNVPYMSYGPGTPVAQAAPGVAMAAVQPLSLHAQYSPAMQPFALPPGQLSPQSLPSPTQPTAAPGFMAQTVRSATHYLTAQVFDNSPACAPNGAGVAVPAYPVHQHQQLQMYSHQYVPTPSDHEEHATQALHTGLTRQGQDLTNHEALLAALSKRLENVEGIINARDKTIDQLSARVKLLEGTIGYLTDQQICFFEQCAKTISQNNSAQVPGTAVYANATPDKGAGAGAGAAPIPLLVPARAVVPSRSAAAASQ